MLGLYTKPMFIKVFNICLIQILRTFSCPLNANVEKLLKSSNFFGWNAYHYTDVIVSTMASQITSLAIAYSTVFGHRSKKASKLHFTGLCEGNSPVTGEFPAQRASNTVNVSIWWRHHVMYNVR